LDSDCQVCVAPPSRFGGMRSWRQEFHAPSERLGEITPSSTGKIMGGRVCLNILVGSCVLLALNLRNTVAQSPPAQPEPAPPQASPKAPGNGSAVRPPLKVETTTAPKKKAPAAKQGKNAPSQAAAAAAPAPASAASGNTTTGASTTWGLQFTPA